VSGSFVYAPYVPLQVTNLTWGLEDRVGQVWHGDHDGSIWLVRESSLVHATGSYTQHKVVDVCTLEERRMSDYKLVSFRKRLA